MSDFKNAFVSLVLCAVVAAAGEIRPLFRLPVSGTVTDFVVDGERICVANDRGMVEVFDLRTRELLDRIVLAPVRSGLGDFVPARVHSVDHRHGKLLIVGSGEDAYRNVWLYSGHTLVKLIGTERKLMVKEARFVDDDRIVMGTFASRIVLHYLGEKFESYSKQVTQSTLGDIALSADRRRLVMSDESGEVRILDVESGRVETVYDSQNVDNVYKVAHAAGVTITAGQDRRVGVYREGAKPYHIKSDFLVYAVGISDDGRIGVYSSGENNDLQLFETATGRKLDRLVGHRSLINRIVFFKKRYLISAGDENEVLFWKVEGLK